MILLNAIRTPDGTVIESTHRHDYVTYEDANGYTYMVDGGLDYLKRTYVPHAPYEELSVDSYDVGFDEVRHLFKWTTYGKNGDQPAERKSLASLETEHIEAILETQHQLSEEVSDFFLSEVVWRKGIAQTCP